MLEYLAIRNFAVIADAVIEFGPGFNVLTGETGAGKSMIVSALSLLRGERAAAHYVRSGASAAVVEAQFCLDNPPDRLQEKLAEMGFEPDEGTLSVERQISAQGKSRPRIAGSLANSGALAEIVPLLVDVSSQHDAQRLLSAAAALEILDTYAGLKERVADLGRLLAQCDALAAECGRLEERMAVQDERRETLAFLLEEIHQAHPQPGEYEKLQQRRRRLASLRDILEAARFAQEVLDAGEDAVSDRLHAVIARLSRHVQAEPRFEEALRLLEEARIDVQEAVSVLRMDEGEDEGESLEWIEERLFRLSRLFKKYRCENEEQLLQAKEDARRELAQLDTAGADLEAVRRRLQEARARAVETALELGRLRREAAGELGAAVTAELADLGFAHARFFVEVSCLRARSDTPKHRVVDDFRLAETGMDAAVFWFEPNPGQAPQPVGRGASGGELSRIHLALQSVLAGRSEVAVTLYDEVDAGIGGNVAMAVGEKLYRLSRVRQVLCITHLPQIAAFADTHFVVEKRVQDGVTSTVVRRLDMEERVREIARMLGGATPEALAHAAALLRRRPSGE